jgi:tyrosinase
MAGTIVLKAIVAALCFTGASAWPFSISKRQTLTLATVQKQALDNALKVLDGTLSDGLTNRVATCNKNTVAVRKE